MSEVTDISVIIPYGYHSPELEDAIDSVYEGNKEVEIILVTNDRLRSTLDKKIERLCSVIESKTRGRGPYCSVGARAARGNIILFLHADTTLPSKWHHSVLEVMADPNIAGGGFTTHFNSDHWFLRKVPKWYNWFSRTINEFWGDRAMFMRRADLLPHLHRIEIPIMEDVEMSRILRRKGKLVLLPSAVQTSELHFTIKGYFRHVRGAVWCRILYAVGVSSSRIHTMYYRKFQF